MIKDDTKLGEYDGITYCTTFGENHEMMRRWREGRLLCMDGGGKGGCEPGQRGVWIYGEGVMSFANGAKDGQQYNAV